MSDSAGYVPKEPTVGRIVWFFNDSIQKIPYAAIVCGRHSSPGLINVAFFDDWGAHHEARAVIMLDDGQEPPQHGRYCRWPEINLPPRY